MYSYIWSGIKNGSSSSGILEAPAFKVATVNIGDRQKNRIQAKTVINIKQKLKLLITKYNTWQFCGSLVTNPKSVFVIFC